MDILTTVIAITVVLILRDLHTAVIAVYSTYPSLVFDIRYQ